MNELDNTPHEWEQLFTQYKNPSGDTVICMVHKATKKRVYFDAQLNRLLSKRESKLYSLDMTGQYSIILEAQR
jgi:hypothetical protein